MRETRRIPVMQTYLFDISRYSHKQLRQFRYAVLSVVTAIAGNMKLDDTAISNTDTVNSVGM